MAIQKQHAIVIGAGPCGLYTALALHEIGITTTIYELRPTPSTIGGAINLAPIALRLLEAASVPISKLGCPVSRIEVFSLHSARKLGELPFPGPNGGGANRMLRKDLQEAMLATVKSAKIAVEFDSKIVGVSEDDNGVTAVFENGKTATGDFLLGCDGVHSGVRKSYVESSRLPKYTQVSAAYWLLARDKIPSPLKFETTAFITSAKGSLMASFCTREKKDIFFAALMSTPEEVDRQGWLALGADKVGTQKELFRRFSNTKIPYVKEMVHASADIDHFLYPIFCLPPRGQWQHGRVLLLGDAAHAMPPQGDSTGLAFEDGALLAKVFSLHGNTRSVEDIFTIFSRTRQPRIDAAYRTAEMRWEKVKDSYCLTSKLKEFLTWAFLWWKRGQYEKEFRYDVREEELVL
jgi:salicylate hydroxylase